MGKVGAKSVSTLFFAGEHREVAERTFDSPSPVYSLDEFPYVIGALVMLGRIEEAETAFTLKESLLSPAQQTASRFFLGVGFCRHSFYVKSRHYFALNAREWRTSDDLVSNFYRYQGLGFYHYFRGSMRKALRAAEKSFESALGAGFLYGRAFAADLKGHTLVLTGDVGRGMKTLELAEHLASQLGALWLQETIQSSLLSYRARFGLDKEETLEKLKKKISGLSKQDSYTQSMLLLNLTEEYLRRGRINDAKEILNECCRIVYSSQNRRHAAMLNLRYAYLHYLEGEPHLSLNLIRNALTQIDLSVDILLELRLRGFEKKLAQEMKLEVCVQKLGTHVTRLTQKVGEGIANRMAVREKTPETMPVRYGEDPIGDLMDLINRDRENAPDAILKNGYLGLLAEVLPVNRGERVLYLELEPGSLTIFDKGSVEHYPDTISKSLRNLLLELFKGTRTKEELIEGIWKYRYHSLRHDALIYSTVAKLRKVLAGRSHWIEASDAGYQLRSDVKVIAHSFKSSASPMHSAESSSPLLAEEDIPMSGLNHRQYSIIKYLVEHDFIDTNTCRTLFETSEITASRDLSELLKMGHLERVGKGRATRYARKQVSRSLQTNNERSLT